MPIIAGLAGAGKLLKSARKLRSKSVKSRYRKSTYYGRRYPDEASRMFETHIESEHRRSLPIAFNYPEELFAHAERADPSKLEEERRHPDAHIRLDFRAKERQYPKFPIDAALRKGSKVLYHYNTASHTWGARQLPEASKNVQHLVVDTKNRTISYFAGGLNNHEIEKLFMETRGDFHKAFWKKVNRGAKTPEKYYGVTSAEYHPNNGWIVHARSHQRRNYYDGREEKLFLFDQESEIGKGARRGKKSEIRHSRKILKEIGERDEFLPEA
ncbi:MAG: hypothetical protein ABID38_06380 [Candidatus Diapherotrites archaeon]